MAASTTRLSLLVTLCAALAACAAAPDAAKMDEARALETQGKFPDAVAAYDNAYALGCSPEKPSTACREALLRAGDAALHAGRPRSASTKYQAALQQPPQDEKSQKEIRARIADAEAAVVKQREAAAHEPPCPVSIVLRENVGKSLSRTRGALSLDGSPVVLTPGPGPTESSSFSSPLPPVEHELTVDFAYSGKAAVKGYKFGVASTYSFVCKKAQSLQIIVTLSASKRDPSARGVEVQYAVQKAP